MRMVLFLNLNCSSFPNTQYILSLWSQHKSFIIYRGCVYDKPEIINALCVNEKYILSVLRYSVDVRVVLFALD
jgi:hypothetical protein